MGGNVIWYRGAEQKTLNLASVLQEIINRGGWSSGNAVVFILEYTGETLDASNSEDGREAITYDGDENLAPELIIEYTN